jgi:hypothetical protein
MQAKNPKQSICCHACHAQQSWIAFSGCFARMNRRAPPRRYDGG